MRHVKDVPFDLRESLVRSFALGSHYPRVAESSRDCPEAERR